MDSIFSGLFPTMGSPTATRSIITAILVYLFITRIALPKIAQLLISRSKLRIIKAAIISPQAHSLTMKLTTVLTDTGPLPVLLKFTRLAKILSLPSSRRTRNETSTTVAQVTMPKQLALPSNGGQVDMTVTVNIESKDELVNFADFSKNLLQSSEKVGFMLDVDGMQVEALQYPIPGLKMNKSVALQGLGGLKDVTVSRADVIGATEEYILLDIRCIMTNNSNVSLINMGDCYFSLYYDPYVPNQFSPGSDGHPETQSPLSFFPNRPYVSSSVGNPEVEMSGAGKYPSKPTLNRRYSTYVKAAAGANTSTSKVSTTIEPHSCYVPREKGSLGTIFIPNMSLSQGDNKVAAYCYFTVPSKTADPFGYDVAMNLLSNFVQGIESSNCFISGHPRVASSIPYLIPALCSLRIPTSLPGLQPAASAEDEDTETATATNIAAALASTKLLRGTRLILNPLQAVSSLIVLASPTKIEMYNPFEVPITILKMVGSVKYGDMEIGTLDVDFNQSSYYQPIVMAPKKIVTSPILQMKLKVNAAALLALVDAAGGRLEVDVASKLDVKTGAYFVAGLEYNQTKVPVAIGLN